MCNNYRMNKVENYDFCTEKVSLEDYIFCLVV